MKEKEGFIDYPEQQVILYVEKEDGQFGPMQTGSYISANFIEDFRSKRMALETELRNQLISNLISPVRFYMVLEELTLSELSARSGICKSTVRKHLDPAGFAKAKVKELERYARVFNIAPANLLQVIMVHNGEQMVSQAIPENKINSLSIHHSATQNPFIVLTNIEEKK